MHTGTSGSYHRVNGNTWLSLKDAAPGIRLSTFYHKNTPRHNVSSRLVSSQSLWVFPHFPIIIVFVDGILIQIKHTRYDSLKHTGTQGRLLTWDFSGWMLQTGFLKCEAMQHVTVFCWKKWKPHFREVPTLLRDIMKKTPNFERQLSSFPNQSSTIIVT